MEIGLLLGKMMRKNHDCLALVTELKRSSTHRRYYVRGFYQLHMSRKQEAVVVQDYK